MDYNTPSYNPTKCDQTVKVYHCRYCSYTSFYRSSITIHSRNHNREGVKKYTCPQPTCLYTTNVKSNLNRHYKRRHSFWDMYSVQKQLEEYKI